MEQSKKIGSSPGLLCVGDRRPRVTDVHVRKCDKLVWKSVDSQTPAAFDFHPHHVRGGRFKRGL